VRVGILKPDHLGDMVLAAPAIAALQRRFSRLTLFCHPKNLGLAEHLFPGLRALPLYLPHLDKEHRADASVRQRVELLRREVDLLICLRWDGQIDHLLTIPEIELYTPVPEDRTSHVTVDQRALVCPFTGTYEILDSYVYPGFRPLQKRPSKLTSVGLCISAGFRLNSWPLCHWLGLAERLHQCGTRVVLIGGPAEIGRLHVLQETLINALGYRPTLVAGGSDFRATLHQLHRLVDLVVATDSGTAHLAALVRPVVSLFGGSPWQKFAPLGRFNAILSRRYPCSPCRQFNRVEANTCHTQECLTNLFPEQVFSCLTAYLEGQDLSRGAHLNGVWMTEAPWSRTGALAA
jgi:ADP-heptose:LPS heptosyltransferase